MAAQTQTIIIALGSNTDSQQHLEQAKRLLKEHLGIVRFSSSMETEPFNMVSPPFLNTIGIGETMMNADNLNQILKSIECECGNTIELREHGKILIDIDLLLLGNIQYHKKDWERTYIRILLNELGYTDGRFII